MEEYDVTYLLIKASHHLNSSAFRSEEILFKLKIK